MQYFERIALVALSLASASCAVEESSLHSSPPMLQPEVLTTTAVETGSDLAHEPILGQFDLSYWETVTSLPETVFIEPWACGLVYRERVPSSQWRLIGVTDNPRYTPILDIYSDKTGNSTANDIVYYHFQLADSE